MSCTHLILLFLLTGATAYLSGRHLATTPIFPHLHPLSPPSSTLTMHAAMSISDRNETFRYFNGINDIVSDKDSDGRLLFSPSVLSQLSPEDSWKWSSERRKKQLKFRNAVSQSGVDLKPIFEELSPYLTADKCDVLQANEELFAAQNSNDMTRMGALWSDAEEGAGEAVCVRSGRTVRGLANVLRFWSSHSVQKQGQGLRATPRDMQLHYFGSCAVVTCTVEEEARRGDKKGGSVYFVTNVFERHAASGRYKLTMHISSLTDKDLSQSRFTDTYMDPATAKSRSMSARSRQPVAIQQILMGGGMDDDGDRDDDGEDSDSDEEETEDDDNSHDVLREKIRNSLRLAVSKLVGAKGGRNVMIFNSNGDSLGSIRGSSSDDDKSEDDNSDAEEEGDEGKVLAAKTLAAVRWLHKQGRLTTGEKRVLTSDIVKNVGGGKFSEAEVAYSILVGDGRPGEWNSDLVVDLAAVDKEDILEFAEACRSLARRLVV